MAEEVIEQDIWFRRIWICFWHRPFQDCGMQKGKAPDCIEGFIADFTYVP